MTKRNETINEIGNWLGFIFVGALLTIAIII